MAKRGKSKKVAKRPQRKAAPAPKSGTHARTDAKPGVKTAGKPGTRKAREVERVPYPALTVALTVLAVGMPILTFPSGYQSFPPVRQLLLVSVALLGAAFLVYYWLKARNISYIYTGIEIPWAAFVGVLTLSTIFALSRSTGFWGDFTRREGLVTWIAYGIIFFLSVQGFRSAKSREWLVSALRYSSIVIVAYGLLQVVKLDFLESIVPSFGGTASSFLGNPAYVGGYISLVAPVFLCLSADGGTASKKRRNNLFVFAFLVIGVIATGSRAAWISVATTSTLVGIHWLYGRGVRLRKAVLQASVVAVVALALATGIGLAAWKSFRVKTFATKETVVNSAEIRVMTWQKGAKMLARRPVLGQGLGTFQLSFPAFINSEWEKRVGHELADDPHDIFLHIAISTGILGLLAFMWLLWTLYFTGWRRLFKVTEKNRFLMGGFLLGSVGYLIHLVFHPSIMDTTSLFWLFSGVALAVPLASRASDDERVKTVSLVKERGGINAALTIGGLFCIALFLLAFVFLGRPVIADNFAKEAMANWSSGKPGAAIQSAGKAASWDPRFGEYRLLEARIKYNRAIQEEDPKSFEDAERELTRLIKANPDWEAARLSLGYSYLMEFEVFWHRPHAERVDTIKSAIGQFQAIVSRDPNYVDAQTKLARCEMYREQFDKALARLNTVYRLRPDWPEPWNVAGNCYLLKGDIQKSKECFQKARTLQGEI